VDLSLVVELEKKIDQLLARKQALEEECRQLLADRDRLQREREDFVSGLDRILAKLDGLDQEVS
jgi:cell division protein ZapB